jgi:hypothetical protein
VDVFDLDRTLVADYASFARSFTQIRARDIRDQVDKIYESRRFWPEPLITVNPHYERGISVEALVRGESLHPDVAPVFRVDGESITLYRHQMQAVAKATARQSFAVTTGTGSGKSLCFFIPIIDAAIRARASGEERRTRAIVIYPMNALANSQREELNKFLDQSGLPENLRPTFARYTGQESAEERERIREAKPDILLTNFMMLELLMTRQSKLDQTVIENAQGLDFIVLDELHTYRGRQGADVAMLVRRLRDRLCRDHPPLCIGTSATMSSQEDEAERAIAVAQVASRLCGTEIPPDAVIDETFERATDPKLKPQSLGAALVNAVGADLPAKLTDEALRSHPLAVWIELEIGLQDGQQLRRRLPIALAEAAKRLAAQTKRGEGRCRAQLQAMLIMMSRPASDRGGTGERAFLAFKVHRFVAGAGHVYATLRSPGQRRVTLDGQRFDPQDPDARLYATFFCRNCGQEHHPVVLAEEGGLTRVLPRPIDETPIDDAEEGVQAGYLTPDRKGDDDFGFTGAVQDYPEDWLETGAVPCSGKSRSIPVEPLGPPEFERGSRRASSSSARPARISRRARRARSTSSRACRRRGGALRRPCWCRVHCVGLMASLARFRLRSASSLVLPTIGRTPRCRRVTSTTSCSCRYCAPPPSPRSEEKGRRGSGKRISGAACSRPWALLWRTSFVGRNGCWTLRPRVRA